MSTTSNNTSANTTSTTEAAPERAPMTKQEARSAKSRQKLLAATVKIIKTQGIAKLNVRGICKEAGLSTGAFYHLFDSKEDVIYYYLNYAYEQAHDEAASELEGLSATDKIRTTYRHFIKLCENAGWEFMSVYYTPTNSSLNFRNRPQNKRFTLEECVGYLAEGQKDGSIRADVDLEEVELEIAAMVTGVMFYWCLFKGDMDATGIFDRNITRYLRSLEVKPEA